MNEKKKSDSGDCGARELAKSPDAIAGAVAREPQGAWSGVGLSASIDAFLLKVVEDLAKSDEINVENVELEAYGYASYISSFVTSPDPGFRAEALRRSGYKDGVAGLNVLLCRLAPLACISSPSRIGPGVGTLTSQGEYLTDRHVEWRALGRAVTAVLRRNEIVVLSPEELDREIDPALDIDTNLGNRPFRVFDAWFNWSD